MQLLLFIALGIALLFILICLTAREQEEFKILKLLGYFLISTLGFRAAHWVIPTGIIFAGLIMYRDRTNIRSKVLAAALGLAIIVLNTFYSLMK